MVTTIQISEKLQEELLKKKMFERETYEEVIWGLVEDSREVNSETKKEIEEARKQAKAGRVIAHEEVKRRYGLYA